MFFLVLQRITYDFLFHILYFPIWWYTVGMKRALLYTLNLVKFANSYMAPGLWLKNIFVPMFGQHDMQGRVASFFVRLGNVLFRSFALLVWFFVCVIIFSIWIALPIFIGFMLVDSLVTSRL